MLVFACLVPHAPILLPGVGGPDDKFYQELIGVKKAGGVYETTRYVRKKYPKIHIECITNIIPGWNDDKKNLEKIACWIIENLGRKTPWHVTRYFPVKIPGIKTNLPDYPTPGEILDKAEKIGKEAGLEFVYIGNMATEHGENTYCPNCATLNVSRSYYSTKVLAVDKKGRCSKWMFKMRRRS